MLKLGSVRFFYPTANCLTAKNPRAVLIISMNEPTGSDRNAC